MRVTKGYLKKILKEETDRILSENPRAELEAQMKVRSRAKKINTIIGGILKTYLELDDGRTAEALKGHLIGLKSSPAFAMGNDQLQQLKVNVQARLTQLVILDEKYRQEFNKLANLIDPSERLPATHFQPNIDDTDEDAPEPEIADQRPLPGTAPIPGAQ